MKKILSIIFLLSFSLALSAQWYGNGLTAATAYYGVINGTHTMQTWNISNYPMGVIYVGRSFTGQYDLEVGTGGVLTIEAGITVKFCTTASDLKITGTGVLSALGSTSSYIIFTKNTQATWGHISFEASTGISFIQYCIIEYGSKTGTGIEGYGGGIHANTSNLTISDCTIRYNLAKWGGGIFVNKNQNPSINNCIIKNNTATYGGGGLNFWNGSYSVVTNCLVYGNYATNPTVYGGGSIFIGPATGSVKIINCTLAKNTAGFRASEIYFDSSPNSRIINSILWGTNTPYYGANSSNFVNCAIQSGYPSGSVGCVNLNSDNNNIAGPNFTAIDGSDWSIAFISPCRDAGVDSYPGVTIPPTDYIGNLTIGTKDIGAYEAQYSRWKTTASSSDWNTTSNWFGGVPTSEYNVIVPSGAANYPTGSSSQDYTIGSGKYMLLEPGAKVTFGSLTNNGTLNLQSSAAGIFSLDMNIYNGTGVANIGMYVTGGGGPTGYKWHYVAVPVNYIGDKSVFTSINQYDLMLYDDSQIPDAIGANDNDGWVWHDGWDGTPGFSDLIVGKGYSFYHPNASAVVNFTDLTSLQTSVGSVPLQYSGDGKLDPTLYGFNLLGNSLTCGLDWNKVILSDPTIRKSIYYTVNFKIGMYVQNTPVGSGINGATKDIPPLQGFLVKTNATGTYLDFSGAKEHTGQQRYKKGSDLQESIPKGSNPIAPWIKLELNNSGNQDETVIWFNENATNSFDGDYDATKMFAASGAYDQIYTISGTEKFGISGIPLPVESDTIPVGIKILKTGSNYKIIASQIQGLDNYKVTLTDKGNANFTVDLKGTRSYSFSSDAGTFPDRFVLTFSNITTGFSDIIIPDKTFNVFFFDRTLNIDLLNVDWEGKRGTINVYNLTGIRVLQQNNVEWRMGDIKRVPLNLPQGVYIVEIKAENQKFVTKINIIK